MTYKILLAIAIILFVIAIAIQYYLRDKVNGITYTLEILSEFIAMLAIFCFVASMAWIIALQ